MSDRREAAGRLLRQRLQDRHARPALPEGDAADELSPWQLGMWISEQLHGPAPSLRPVAVKVSGPLDVDALDRAVRSTIDRHVALRATFALRDGEPVLAPEPPGRGGLRARAGERPIVEGADPVALGELAWQFAADLPVLGEAPPRLVDLVALPDGDHVVLWTMSHLLIDGSSAPLLVAELARSYEAALQGRTDDRPAAPDYLAAAREAARAATGPDAQKRIDRSRRRLQGLHRAPLPSGPSSRAERQLDRATSQLLESTARRYRTTPFVLLVSAWALASWRRTARPDTIVDVPIDRRPPWAPDLVGSCFTSVPVPVRVRADETMGELVRRCRATVAEVIDDADVRYRDVVAGHPSLAETTDHRVVLQTRRASPAIERGRCRWELLTVDAPRADQGVGVMAVDHGGHWTVEVGLGRDGDRLADDLVAALAVVLGDDDVPLRSFGPDLTVWPGSLETELRLAPVRSVIDAVEAQVRATPDATAVEDGDDRLSYAELWTAATDLARALDETGVPARASVALDGPRGRALVAGFVGVLASGRRLVPLEPALPPGRRRQMSESAGVVATVTTDPDGLGLGTVIGLGTDGRPVSPGPSSGEVSRLGYSATEDGEAYVFFTSGSTGRPKGIVGRRRALDQFMAWYCAEFSLGPHTRLALLTAMTFDPVLRIVLGPLMTGGTVVVPPPDLAADGVLDWIAATGVNALNTTPGNARAWLDDRTGEARPALAWTVFAGEFLTGDLVERWRRTTSCRRIVNLYGQTETTMVKTAWDVPDPAPAGPLPVGRPLPGTQLLLHDEEVLIRTPYGTGGYLDEPLASWRAYHAHPTNPDETVYRSGDNGSIGPDGLVLHGRRDQQVKIEGVRVEPLEVAATLEAFDDVDRAHVAATMLPAGLRLVAWVRPAPGAAPSPADLRRRAAEYLPTSMLPARIELIEQFPLSTNGKVDTARLLAGEGVAPSPPAGGPVGSDHEPADPADPGSLGLAELCQTFAEVLSLDAVGADDDFFALGGSSLAAARLLARVRDRTGSRRLALGLLLDAPTPSTLLAELMPASRAKPAAAVAEATALPAAAAPGEGSALVRAFLDTVAADPDAPALVDGARRWSRRDLVAWAGAIATRLRAAGIAPGDRVALVQGREPALVAGTLAVLATGGTAVPVDPDLPVARRRMLVDDAGIRLVVGGDDLGATVVSDEAGTAEDLRLTPPPSDIAYVLYTSGTTGRPKGVLLTGDALLLFCRSVADLYGVVEGDRIGLLHSTGFDGCLEEIWLPLVSGGTIVVDDIPLTGAELATWAGRNRLDILVLPTTGFVDLADHLARHPADRPPTVRVAAFAGQALPASAVELWNRAVGGAVRAINCYGPTESTRAVVFADLGGRVIPADAPVPIGRPLPEVHVDVVDPSGARVDGDGEGELWVGGPLVSPGYLDRPDESAAFQERDGVRWYATGDRVRRVGDELLFLGRLDDQVQVGGYRIEMAEVERALLAHPGVHEAAVWAVDDDTTASLGARVSPRPGHRLEAATMRSHLAALLHPMAVPRHVEIGPIERTERGKTARIAPRSPAPGPLPADGPVPASLSRAPATSSQERLWLLARLHPDRGDWYHVERRTWLDGPLDPERLEAAVAAAVERHGALRTVFDRHDGRLEQVVLPRPARIVDTAVVDSEAEALERSASEIQRPFDLGRGPLFRAGLTRIRGTDRQLLHLVGHHTVLDLAAISLVEAEVARAVESPAVDEQSGTARLQLADLGAWQDHRRRAGALDAEVDAWVDHLRGLGETIHLPGWPGGDRPVAHEPVPAVTPVDELARRLRTTPLVTLLTLTACVLHRLTGADEVLLATPVSERIWPGSEETVGFLANTLPLRVGVGAGDRVADVAARVRAEISFAAQHCEAPFDEIVRRLGRAGDEALASLTAVVVSVTETTERPPWRSVRATRIARDWTPGPKFPLAVALDREPASRLRVETDPAVVDGDLAAPLVVALRELAEQAREAPDTPVGRLPLVPPGLTTWLAATGRRDTGEDEPSTLPPDRWRNFARAHPDRLALVDGGRRTTHGDLLDQVDRLATELRRVGLRPHHAVEIAGRPSTDQLVAVLAVAGVGATYVPVEPDTPPLRLAAMREAAGVGVRVETATGDAGLEILDLGRRAAVPGAAYVMFTSGSTGTPKGVAVPWAAIGRLVMEPDYVTLGPDDVVAFASNPAFDAATFELWGAMANGASLLVVERDTLLDPRRLGRALRDGRVTVAFLTTALVQSVARTAPSTLSSLAVLLFGGERCDPDAVRRLVGGPRRLVHVYGPTENTTFSTWHEVEAVPAGARSVPIGRPIRGTSLAVVDRGGQPLPPGLPGELWLGGTGLALGYAGDDGSTAARFVTGEDGRRWYRSGDLVRQRPDGQLDHLGRIDRQIKVRGHRIEPGEVELALRRLPAVTGAHAGLGPDGSLAAWISLDDEGHDVDVRAELAGILPAWSVPTHVVVVEELPLNRNGKIDPSALPTPSGRRAVTGQGATAPPGSSLERMCEIWALSLGLDAVGPDDDFFDLGGTSIGAVELSALVEQRLSVVAPLRSLFDHRTPRALSSALAAADLPEDGDSAAIALRHGDGPPLWLLPAGGGHVFHYMPLVADLPPGRPVRAVQAHGYGRWSRRDRTVTAMADRYLDIIEAQQPDGPYLLAGHSLGSLVAAEVARRLQARGDEVGCVVLLDPSRPGGGPMGLLREAARRARRAESWTEALTWRWRMVRRRLRGRRPSARLTRRRLMAAGWAAAALYRLPRLDLPVTLVLATPPGRRPDDGVVSSYRAKMPQLTVRHVKGRHDSFLAEAAALGLGHHVAEALGDA